MAGARMILRSSSRAPPLPFAPQRRLAPRPLPNRPAAARADRAAHRAPKTGQTDRAAVPDREVELLDQQRTILRFASAAAARCSAALSAWRCAMISAWALARSVGGESSRLIANDGITSACGCERQSHRDSQCRNQPAAARSVAAFASQCLRAGSPVAPV